jgi:hypothetical protein
MHATRSAVFLLAPDRLWRQGTHIVGPLEILEAHSVWGIVVFGIVTLANLIIFLRQYRKDHDVRALMLRGVVIVGSVAGSVMAYNAIGFLRHENQSLAAENKSMARDLQFAKAVATMHIGGGL